MMKRAKCLFFIFFCIFFMTACQKKEPVELKVNVEEAKKWLSNGAQPTDTAKALLKKAGVIEA